MSVIENMSKDECQKMMRDTKKSELFKNEHFEELGLY